jgi:hypothetical protein
MSAMEFQTIRHFVLTATSLCLLFAAAQSGSGQVQRALLTVDGLNIPPGGALAAFHIDTWGVKILAVCEVPPLWAIKEYKSMDPSGVLSGSSDPYHRTLVKLDRLFLIDVYGYQPLPKGNPKGDYHPASFAGWFEVIDGNGDVIKKRRVLHASNFHLIPSLRCPDAPPAEP